MGLALHFFGRQDVHWGYSVQQSFAQSDSVLSTSRATLIAGGPSDETPSIATRFTFAPGAATDTTDNLVRRYRRPAKRKKREMRGKRHLTVEH